MSIHIHLIDPPEYYTNLDTVSGQVSFFLSKPENVGAIVVKLEGEASTALTVPIAENVAGWTYRNIPLGDDADAAAAKDPTHPRPSPGTELKENHKILYQVAQAYPPKTGDIGGPPASTTLQPGQHTFPFQFQLPFNNTCADPSALARSGGLVDADGNTDGMNGGPGRFGLSASGIRVMNGSKQLLLRHMRQTLPPSFGGSAGQVEIRYFLKVTVQRPGLFKENWRQHVSFRFLPIEPPRPPPTTREVFARRPFAFKPRATTPTTPTSIITPVRRKSSSFFGRSTPSSVSVTLCEAGDQLTVASPTPSEYSAATSAMSSGTAAPLGLSAAMAQQQQQQQQKQPLLQDGLAPSIQISALLPFPAILTCNQPVPLRLTARKLLPSREVVYLTALEIRLIGMTRLLAQDLRLASKTSWLVLARPDLSIAVCEADGPVDSEIELPDSLWRAKPLPSTVMPSFRACNVSREYELEVRITLSWGLPSAATAALRSYPALSPTASRQEKKARKATLKALQAQPAQVLPQTIRFPLNFAAVDVYSGIRPTEALVAAVSRHLELQEQRRRRREQVVDGDSEDDSEDSEDGDSDVDSDDDDDEEEEGVADLQLYDSGGQKRGVHELPLETPSHELPAQQLEPVELPALPPRTYTGARQMAIRRRPVPQQQQQQQQNQSCPRPYQNHNLNQQQLQQREQHDQHGQQGQEKRSSLYKAPIENGNDGDQSPQQEYHMYRQQTYPQTFPQTYSQTYSQSYPQRRQTNAEFGPPYPPRPQAGEDASSLASVAALAAGHAGHAGRNGHIGGEHQGQGEGEGEYGSAYEYDDPPPTYDEAMTSVLDLGGGVGSDRPAFGGGDATGSPADRSH